MGVESTDEQRGRAVENMLHKAERDLGLHNGSQHPLRERAQRILAMARQRPLSTPLYRLAWFLWKHVPATTMPLS